VSSQRSLVVAILPQEEQRVLLYRVVARRHASLLRAIDPPRGPVSLDAGALSGGDDPRVCAVWRDEDPQSDADGEELVCDGVGSVDKVELGSISVALDPTGHEVFWSVDPEDGTSTYTLARLGPHELGSRRTHDLDCPRYLVSVGWGDASHVVLHCSTGDSDDPGRLAWQQLGDVPAPAVDIPVPRSTPAGYDLLLDPGGYLDGGVLGIQRVDCVDGCPVKLPRRAVRVDPRTGKVLEVVATPAKGRQIGTVSGGAHGVVYSTYSEAGGGLRVYLRWPGEKHGTLITGLPADLERVVAQP
jgi:hypothetical protein